MNCRKAHPLLDAYRDGELSDQRRRVLEAHLAVCRLCREQHEGLGQVGDMLDSLEVPPLPHGFAARVVSEAHDRRLPVMQPPRALAPLDWWPLRWFGELSSPMRLAACGALLLACLLGMFMSKEFSLQQSRQTPVATTEGLEGFEWFSPTPPTSLGAAYLNLALTSPEDRGRP
jgi:anti-sigma factor RsiW